MSVTNRCRVVLALAPILVPAFFIMSIIQSFVVAINAFFTAMYEINTDDWHFWYREVYRPARYGSVYDK